MIDDSRLDRQKYSELLDYFVQYAREDWVMVDLLYGYMHEALPSLKENGVHGEPLEDYIDLGELLLKDLFLRGVLIGDLVEGTPGFEPWDGDEDDWLSKILDWITRNKRLPEAAELAWLHIPKAA